MCERTNTYLAAAFFVLLLFGRIDHAVAHEPVLEGVMKDIEGEGIS